jgi:cysteine desulfurase
MTLYLDYNATTPIDPRVQSEIIRCFAEGWGNAGSPHEFGQQAKSVVHAARDRIGRIVAAKRHDIVFTSGATESNNLAILGLADYGNSVGRRHIVSTQIEHPAVLEPLAVLRRRGFDVTLIAPDRNGRVPADAILQALRPDTLLLSIMHVNNETGMVQPIAQVAGGLGRHEVLLHVDAAQGFGKDIPPLQHQRIDLISISSHKIFGPVGIGALVVRHRRKQTIPLSPLLFGGGQELGLRPGTLPVALISGFGIAAEIAAQENSTRHSICRRIRERVLQGLQPLRPVVHGDLEFALPHVLNASFPGWDGDQIVERLHGVAAVATGSACTSVCATASHVLAAMNVQPPALDGAVRFSWSHLTDETQLRECLIRIVNHLRQSASPNESPGAHR